ncbi:Fatty acid synthase [Eumeta japonica]|uniref:Fatty acid synthase n=1 Tax=Eumeta variegata TaxID=151549 RepID=A0A4C1WLC4_EUMVA|nr:Fatty acid synthase [Eumeta japonica]
MSRRLFSAVAGTSVMEQFSILFPDFPESVGNPEEELGVLCDDGKSRSFDKNAGGAVRADAVNCLFLQKAKNAKRIYSKVVYLKSSYTTDKAVDSKELKFGPVRPKKCLIEFWNDFYREANVSPQVVEYVEAYGSAVPEADRAELDAIGEVFCKGKEDPLPIGSVISNIGHTEAASGVSAVTKVLLAYHSGQIPANLYYETPHDQVQAICDGQIQVVVENQTFSRTYVAINSHSLSGINCHILLHGFHKKKDLEKYKTSIPRLVTLSGRTESSVSKIIHQLKAQPLDEEEIGLLHNIHKQDIQGHLARGYAVLTTNEEGQTVSLAENCDYYPDIRRPVWFVYSGMGSQWAGMGAQLLRIPIFANAIEKCRRVLEPKGVDLIKILVEPDKAIYDNILNSFVGIAAVQIGLTDVLRELNVVPDNIIGHSVGELGCAYADGCFTAEEMILSAYSRGLVSVKTSFIRGAMAAVGLGYKDMVGLCPPEIEVACHNGPESSTISGPADVMRAFVQELTAKGIFAKEVPCSNIAYHSRYIAKAGPELLKYLKEVIKDPKPRSQKWVSTSVPRDKWDEPEAKYSSAEYHTNNLLRSVLFEETSRLIPNNAVVIEIAPHGLLQAILKRSLGPNCVHVPLTRRGHSDSVTFLLDNIGKLYQAGLTPQVQALYPKISFPVSNGTPMLSHLVEWMHTEKWPLPKYAEQNYSKSGRRTILVSVHDEEYKYIKGNVKDACVNIRNERASKYPARSAELLKLRQPRVLVPSDDKRLSEVIFYCRFHIQIQSNLTSDKRAILGVSPNMKLAIRKSVEEPQRSTLLGAIILSEAGILVLVWETLAMMMENKMVKVPVQFCDVRFDSDVVASDDEVLVLDVTIQKGSGQFEVTHRRNIVASGCIRRHCKENMSTVVIEPVEEEYVTSSEIYKMFHLKGYSYRCGGVSMQDITLNDVSQPERPTVIKRREFVPYHPVETFDVNTVVHVFLQIVAENSSDGTINAVEFVMSKDEQPLGDLMKIVSNELTNLQKVFTKIINKHKFIISIEENEVQVTKSPCVEIAAIKTSIGRLILAKMQTKEEINEDTFFIAAPEDVANISFIEHTRNNLLPTQRLIVMADMPPPSGLLALISKWKTEQEKNKINLIITDTRTNSDCNIKEQLNKDLAVMTYSNKSTGVIIKFFGDVFNLVLIARAHSHYFKFIIQRCVSSILVLALYKDLIMSCISLSISDNKYQVICEPQGSWGCEYYLPSNDDQAISPTTRMNSTAPGENESLSCMEVHENASSKSVQVQYAGLTHYDNLKAATATSNASDNGLYCMDYSGLNSRGERVMGVVASGALAPSVMPDEDLLWPVPEHWTLEDAATVPQPYIHAFYCLNIRSKFQDGSRILVHCGTGALGQAIISIALGVGCEVFTTVSSARDKQFLKSLFPDLEDNHICSCRDVSFEHVVMEQTNGEGCAFVVSCLDGELRELLILLKSNYTLRAIKSTSPLASDVVTHRAQVINSPSPRARAYPANSLHCEIKNIMGICQQQNDRNVIR